MYKVTTKSNRLYLDENSINADIDTILSNNIVEFNLILYSAYNTYFLKYEDKEKYNKLLGEKSFHMYIKDKFNLNTYYTNSIVRLVEAKFKAQVELQKLYIDEIQEQINAKQSTLDKTEKYLKNLQELEDRITEYRVNRKTNSKASLINVKGLKYIKIKHNKIYVKINKEWIEYSLGKFEYDYLLPEIRKQKHLIGGYKHRINNLEIKLEKFKKLKRIIFGTKKFMQDYNKSKYTKLEFLRHKYQRYEISGRCDFLNGNRMIMPEYNENTNTLRFRITTLHNKIFYIDNVVFPYRQDELVKTMKTVNYKANGQIDGTAISCGIRRCFSNDRIYYQIDTVFDIEKLIPDINYDKSNGIVALDFNLGHVDMTELDSKGNLVNHKTLYYELNKNSKQNEISLRKVLDIVGQYAKDRHKIIVVENLDLTKLKTKMNSDKKNQKVLNKYIHSFPYSRYENIVDNLKIKYHLDIIKVKPNFTSIIGELKYANYKKLNTHISASYVIGRRGLGFTDFPIINQCKQLINKQPLKDYKSNWSMWSKLDKMKTA